MEVSPSFARLSAPQMLVLHPVIAVKSACLWGSSQATPGACCTLSLWMQAQALAPQTVGHIHSPWSGTALLPACLTSLVTPPLSHAVSQPSTSVEKLVGLPQCPAVPGTPHSQLESLRGTSGEALGVVAICIRCLLSTESEGKMPSRLP